MRLLGPLEVWRGEEQVHLGGVKQRVLLAHLALNANTGVSIDQLVEVLWPAARPRSVVANLRTYVWQLRQLLDPDSRAPRVRTHGAGYVLVVSPHEVDALHFAELVESARVEPSPAAALELLRRAESLWRGQPFEDLPECVSWSPLLARLAECRLAATEQRLTLQVSLGDGATAIPELRALLAAHPYRESICRQLMIALRRGNRQVEALQVYTDIRDRLTNELGLEPGTELREAHLAILRGDDEPADVRHDAQQPAPIRQLPPSVSDFSGRVTETAQLAEVLRMTGSDSVPVAGVTGSPGVGKSTLAVRVAHQVRDHFPDGQLYVDLAGTADDPRDPGDVLGELLHAFGITGAGLPAGVAGRAALYRSLLAGRRVLVLLDDAASVSQVVPLLPADPGCAVLVTSRRMLTELPGASHLELQPFPPADAAELLARIAGRDRITAEPEEAAAIARACDHLPLAIRVAGARLAGRGGWPLRVLRERLIDESTRLRELRAGELAVRASFDLSVRQLPADGLRAFVLLALLGPQDVPGWVVDALLDQRDTEDLVDQLVDANLLGSSGTDRIGQPRYRLHDLLRCHALDLADRLPEGERSAALDRTLSGWLWLAGQAAARLPATFGATIADDGGWACDRRLLSDPVAWFVAERRALCGAVDLAADAGLDDLAWRLAATAVPFFDLHSHYEDWARTHSRALKAVRAAANKAGEAAMSRGLAQVHIYRNEFDEAERGMLDAYRLYGEIGDQRGEGLSLAGVGTVCRLRAENGQAMRCYEKSLRKLESADDRHSIAQVRASIGSIHAALGDLEQARVWLTGALHMAVDIEDAHREALVLCRLAALHRQTGEHDTELDCARRAVSILEELTDERCTAFARLELAEALIPAGQHDIARVLVHHALATYRRTGNRQGEPAALRTLARVALAEGDQAAAARTSGSST